MKSKCFKFLAYIFLLLIPAMAAAQDYAVWFKPPFHFDPHASGLIVAVGDLNNDGRDDAAMVSDQNAWTWYSYRLMVYKQNDSGTLTEYDSYDLYNWSESTGAIDIGDLNGDGRNDVVIGSTQGITIYYQGATSGTLDTVEENNFARVYNLQVVDVDGDTYDDVVVQTSDSDNLYVLYQDGGSLGTPTAYPITNVYNFRVADVNDDGVKDIVAGRSLNRVGILHQNPARTFSASTDYTARNSPDSIVICNLNGGTDSLNDIFAKDGEEADIFYQNGSGGMITPATTFETVTYSSRSGFSVDANRDGLDDVVLFGGTTVDVVFQQSGGALRSVEYQYLPYTINLMNNNFYSMDSGDVNNDGIPDIVTADSGLVILHGHNNTPAYSVQRPYRGAIAYTAEHYHVEWGYSHFSGTDVSIFYSTDGGASWNSVTDSTKNDGIHDWEVPLVTSTNCKLLIVNASGGEPQAESYIFEIRDDGVDRLLLRFPNGGETYAAGSTVEVAWNSTGSIADVKLELSTDNGTTWTEVVSSTTNDHSYSWTVPNTLSALCLMRISNANNSNVFDISEAVFQIVDANAEILNLTAPNGGEVLTGGDTFDITWNSFGFTGQVALHYSYNNGTSWVSIANNTENDGTYTWTVPNTPSGQCLVRVQDASDGSPTDQSAGSFSIGTSGTVTSTITVTYPNGGESFYTGLPMPVTWTSTGAVGDVELQYSTNGGASWTTIATTGNTGSYDWGVPDSPSTNCLIRIREASDNNPSDTSDAPFTITDFSGGIFITSPGHGDYFSIGAVHDITWTAPDDIAKVKIEYSTNNRATWTTIAGATGNDGKYSWTVPNTPSNTCNIRITDAADGDPVAISFGSFSIVSGAAIPEISLNRSRLNYASVLSSMARTPDQSVVINNTGIGTLKWKAAKKMDDENDPGDWLTLGTTTGINATEVQIKVNPVGLSAGTYSGTVSFTDDNASNSPQTTKVYLTVKAAGTDAAPFGTFDTPGDNTTVMSSIPVTGWVLDDVGIDKVTIWRSGTAAEGGGLVYIDDAILVDGARADVEATFPGYPENYKAGWGYMMLTNGLPGGGNGIFTIYAYAKDLAGNEVLLGKKTINCDNANAVKPFGAIDKPEQGGLAYSTKYRCQGWALTPQPNTIPTDGSTIKLLIDGKYVANVHYNIYRKDIKVLFPGYNNSNGALGYYDFDTTAFDNGIHTIQWTATDNAGNTDGIGSRFFTIQNSGYSGSRSQTASAKPLKRRPSVGPISNLSKIPTNASPILLKTGYSKTGGMQKLKPFPSGIIDVAVRQDERLVMQAAVPGTRLLKAYLEVKGKLRPLPPGSTLDLHKGKFYWQIGPGIFGKYNLIFVSGSPDGKLVKQTVRVTVNSKY